MHTARVAPEKTAFSARPADVLLSAERMEKRMATYSEKLKDPRWQKKRLEILNRDEWKCSVCCSGEKTLHVHHAYYVSGREPWEYPSDTLTTLCEECHHGADDASDSLMVLIERVVEFACEIAPEGMPAENVMADLGLMIGVPGRDGPLDGKRRRLTDDEWIEFYRAVPRLLESYFTSEGGA